MLGGIDRKMSTKYLKVKPSEDFFRKYGIKNFDFFKEKFQSLEIDFSKEKFPYTSSQYKKFSIEILKALRGEDVLSQNQEQGR